MQPTKDSDFHIGQRVSYGSCPCTIRYIGAVKGTKGEWLGIEWDDPKLGKHAGEHEGFQYFKCLNSAPTAASFIRLTRPADPSLSFLSALKQKYAPDNNLASSYDENPIEFSGKVVEEVGFEKVRQQQAILNELRVVVLDGLCVAGLLSDCSILNPQSQEWQAYVEEVHQTCPKVRELDLSRSLIERRIDIVGICGALPDLRRLVLSGNRINDFSLHGLESKLVTSAFWEVTELDLSSTFISWRSLTELIPHFPSLTTLNLNANNLSVPLNPPLISPGLQHLSLSHNPLKSLTSIHSLRSYRILSSLTSLSLSSCSITSLDLLLPPFEHLKTLDLSSNSLPTLETLDTLPSSFPVLTSLRVSPNPFFNAMKPDDAHMLTLARIPGIKTLNYSDINAKERENAELYYLSKIKAEVESALATAQGDSAQETQLEKNVLANHPQYNALAQKHGAPPIIRPSEATARLDKGSGKDAEAEAEAEAARGGYGPNTLWARIVTLHLRVIRPNNPNSRSPTNKSMPNPPSHLFPQTKKSANEEVAPRPPSEFEMQLPKSTNIYRLKSLIGSRIGLWARDFKLIYETGDLDPVGRHIKGLGQPGGGREIWEAESESESSESGSHSEEGEGEEEDREVGDDRNDVGEWGKGDGEGEEGEEREGVDRTKRERKKKKKPTWDDYDPRKWVRREVELVESMRTLGYWVEGRDARIRVEVFGG